MNELRIKIENGSLTHHFQKGLLRLIQLPKEFNKNPSDNKFFAYLSTLGGGIVNKDEYLQDFSIENTNATISSQSNQKIYKGKSKFISKIKLDDASKFIFHNDANIFYKNSDFFQKTSIFLQKNSKLFYLDGGFIGYCNGEFKANTILQIFINSNLKINDNFYYQTKQDLNLFFKYEYFYNIAIVGNCDIININNENIKAFASKIENITIIRIASNDNDVAMKYIDNLKINFIKENA